MMPARRFHEWNNIIYIPTYNEDGFFVVVTLQRVLLSARGNVFTKFIAIARGTS